MSCSGITRVMLVLAVAVGVHDEIVEEGTTAAATTATVDVTKTAKVDGNTAAASRQVLEVVLIRHGESLWNANEIAAALLALTRPKAEKYYDAPLVGQGIKQALDVQDFLLDRYKDFKPEEIQLAGSALSRAYDTLILATAKLWQKWDANKTQYHIDQVPALMEFGNVDTKRKRLMADSTLVQRMDSIWDDPYVDTLRNDDHLKGSAFFGLVEKNDWKKFYQVTEQDDMSYVAMKSKYERHRRYEPDKKTSCNPEQIRPWLEKYFVDLARSGKKVVIVGTHSNLIRCAMNELQVISAGNDTEKVHASRLDVYLDKNTGLKFGGNTNKSNGDISSEKVPNGGMVLLQANLDYGSVVQYSPTAVGKCESKSLHSFPIILGRLKKNVTACMYFDKPWLVKFKRRENK